MPSPRCVAPAPPPRCAGSRRCLGCLRWGNIRLAANVPACASSSGVGSRPIKASSARPARMGVGATAPKAMATSSMRPVPGSSVTWLEADAMAMSMASRGVKRWKQLPVMGAGSGTSTPSSRPDAPTMERPGPTNSCSTGMVDGPMAAIGVCDGGMASQQSRGAVGGWRRVAEVPADGRHVAQLEGANDLDGFHQSRVTTHHFRRGFQIPKGDCRPDAQALAGSCAPVTMPGMRLTLTNPS